MFENDLMIDNTLTEQEKNQIWPLITQYLGIEPRRVGTQRRSEIEALLGEIANIINPNRPSIGDEDKLVRLENKVEEYEKLVEELSASFENMGGTIDKAMNKIHKIDRTDEDW